MPDAHKNFAYSTVATPPSPPDTGTSLVVQVGDGAKFPPPPFNATVWPVGEQPLTTNAEIVRVTAISIDTLTITRTQESTSARSILVDDQIAATITAKVLTDAETRPIQLTIISASGGWVVPTGVYSILAEAWGGGGAGGGSGSATGSGAGGGSGSYARAVISTTPGETLTATVGAGGAGAPNAAGGNGTSTLLQRGATTLLQANGGTGGPAASPSSVAGGAGGIAGTGDYTVPGQQGGPTPASGALAPVNGGGSAPLGGPGGAVAAFPGAGTSVTGNPGVTPGGGGSGSSTNGSGPNIGGGNGAPGFIVITY